MSQPNQNQPNPRISLARTLMLAAVLGLLAMLAAGFHKDYLLGASISLLKNVCLGVLSVLVWNLPDNAAPTSRMVRLLLGMASFALALGIAEIAYIVIMRPDVTGWFFWIASLFAVSLPIWAVMFLRRLDTRDSLEATS